MATQLLLGPRKCEIQSTLRHFLILTNHYRSVDTMIDQFVQLYTRGAPKWDNMSSLATAFGWTDMIAQSTSEYLDTHGVSPKFTREMVEAATRVNYGQDADQIHALEGACSLATTGATSIKGGNFQIFEQFLLRSKANVFLNTSVCFFTLLYINIGPNILTFYTGPKHYTQI